MNQFRLMTRVEKDAVRAEIIANCDLIADCWVYRTQNSEGYGVKKIARKLMYTSRFMLCYATCESINIKLDACHVGDCPYRACCNPAHLAWGTHQDNVDQRERKRKDAQSDPRWWKSPALGHKTHGEHAMRTVYPPLFEPERLDPMEGQQGGGMVLQGVRCTDAGARGPKFRGVAEGAMVSITSTSTPVPMLKTA